MKNIERVYPQIDGQGRENLSVQSEANWLSKGGSVLGNDTRLLEDIYGDLQGRIGSVRG